MGSLWQRFRKQKPWAKILEVEALVLMLIGGLLVVGGKISLDQTNTIEFCTSCHEMRDNNYEEYKGTIHARNRTGVKATCSDCHVPHEFVDTMIRKVKAANDVFQHLAGTIETREKFEDRRLELAKRVWLRMKETDSRECRHCHDTTAMDPEKQGKTAQKQHQKLAGGQRTCIDCHFGIAHHEPAGGLEPRDALDK
ncbi:MAG TPA: NapC/NirT family cytochrome c [Azonexus sp.]|nr:NapC/NirT family cytochrome c [Azonexus sp.]